MFTNYSRKLEQHGLIVPTLTCFINNLKMVRQIKILQENKIIGKKKLQILYKHFGSSCIRFRDEPFEKGLEPVAAHVQQLPFHLE